MDYLEYEEKVEEIKKDNEKYLKMFQNSLEKQGLSSKTIRKHYNNVEFYINDYLNYYEPIKMQEGSHSLSSYLGGWVIEKCLFASKTYIKESATSIKKFYKCMLDNNYIKKIDYDYLCLDIKDNLDDWIDLLEDYDDGTYYDDFF